MSAARTVFIDTALSDYQSLAAQYDAAVFNVVLLNNTSAHAGQIQSWMTANGVSPADINIVSASTSMNGAFTPRVVFVDAGVADIGTVIAGVPANATVVVLDPARDGIQQIKDYLAANAGQVGAIDIVTDLASVDVVSHGAPGEITLGSTVLNADNLASYSSQLASIGSHLSAGGDILLYGCDVASGTTGQQFITALASATGADVAASTDLTGSAAAGGDWTLEANTGTIETTALNIAGYDALLANVQTINTVTMEHDADPGAGILTNKATQKITVSFSANGNADLPTIWVSTDGTGASKTQVPAANIQYNNGTKTGTFTVTVTLDEGANKSLQFFKDNGNTSLVGTFQYTLDRTPPPVPTITRFTDNTGSTSDTLTQDTTPTLTISAEADSTVQVFRNGQSVGTATQTATKGIYTFTSAALADGSHNFTATAADALGNQSSASTAQNVTVDTTAPTPSLALAKDSGAPGDGRTNDASLVFSTVESGGTRVIKVDGAVVTAYDASKLADGQHTVSVTDTDAAGNAGNASATFTLDTKAPTASVTLGTDSGTSNTDGLTNNAGLNFGALEAGATRVIKVDGNLVGAYDASTLADGQHTVEITDTDAAGNAGKSSVTFTLDTTLTTPTIKLAQDTGTNSTDGVSSNGALNIGAADNGATRVITVDGQAVGSYDPKALGDGAHTVSVTDTDAAGNVRTASTAFTLDTKAPVATASLADDTGTNKTDGLTSKAGVNFGALEAGATRVITVDGNVVGNYDPSKLGDGAHTVGVTDTDAAGNAGTASVSFTLDTKAPSPGAALLDDTGTDAHDGITSKAGVTFSPLEAGATRVITVDGTVVGNYDPSKLGDGSHTVDVTDTDAAGNAGTTSMSFTLDTKAPAPTASLAEDTGANKTDGLTSNGGINFGALENGASRVITVDGTVVANYDPTKLSDGAHTVDVTDTDAAGNEGTSSVTFTLDTKAPAPTAALTKDSGKNAGDSLTNDASVSFSKLEDGATRVITVDGKVVGNYDASVLADGQHKVDVTDTDAAGNAGTTSMSFTLDTKAPAPTASLAEDTGTNKTDGLTSKGAINFSALENGATRVIKVDGVAGASDPSKLADGQHTVDVTDTDAAGNEGTTSVIFTLDTKAPAPTAALLDDTGKDAHDGITRKAGVTFGALEAGATRVITVDGAVVGNYDPSKLGDGTHTVDVTDTDAAGNEGTTSLAFTLDTTAPVTSVALAEDTGANKTDGLTNKADVNFGALEAGATRVITVDGKAVSDYKPGDLADGHHTVDVTDTDAAGNEGKASVSFTLDTTAPTPTAALTKDSGKDAGDGLTNDASVSFGALEAGATRVITVDGKVVGNYDASVLADGQHKVDVTDTDAAGNAGTTSLSFTLDTKAPVTSAALADDTGTNKTDSLTSNAAVTFGALEAGASRVITVDGAVVGSYDPTKLADGTHTVEIADTDAAGNKGTSSVSFTLDTKAPTPTAALAKDTGSNGGDGLTSDAGVNFSTLESGATRVITVDGTVVGSYDPSKLADGKHTVDVTDTDAAGNAGTTSLAFTLDTKAPVTSAALADDTGTNKADSLTSNAAITFGALEAGASRVITVDGTVVGSYDPSKLADGTHTVEIADTDAAGNKGTSSVSFTLDTKAPAPTAALARDTGANGSDGLTNDAGVDFSTLESGATRVIKVDGKVVGSYDPAALADGLHTVEIADTDGAGNVGTSSATFTLDKAGPSFSSAATASVAENIGENQPVYKAAATDAHGVSFSLAGADAAKFNIAADGSVTLKENPNYEGVSAYGFTVVATDSAGNHTDKAVSLAITNVNEAPVASSISKSTIENTALSFQVADYISDPDAGDKLVFSLGAATATLSWANTDPAATKTLINPVTKAAVDLSSLSVKAVLSADGTTVTLTPPSELDWLVTGQAVKATLNYSVTDASGLKSQDAIELLMNGSTNDKGVNLSGGNGDDVLAGNTTNNAEDVLSGNNGNDNLSGFGGTDALYGGNGDDKLYGGAGIDYLYGDSGNDTLDGGTEGDYIFGGKGNDLLTGGSGADKFVFSPQNGNDRITDFKLSEGDKLYFADFFTSAMTVDTFLSKYVTDTGNDLQINLQGTTITVVGVANVSDLAGAINFGIPV